MLRLLEFLVAVGDVELFHGDHHFRGAQHHSQDLEPRGTLFVRAVLGRLVLHELLDRIHSVADVVEPGSPCRAAVLGLGDQSDQVT